MAFLAILVIFAPIATFGQQWTHIIIEPEMVLSNADSNVVATIAVTIDGDLDDDGNIQLIIEGVFGSNDFRKYEETSMVTHEEPTHVFELNYLFTPNEVYQLTVIFGDESNTIEWVPSIPTQKESETEKSQNEPDEVTVERVTTEKSIDTNEGVTNALIQQEATSLADSFEASNEVQPLIEENELLKQEIEKKDAIIEEQKKVIKYLKSEIKNAFFDESTVGLYFIDDTSEDADLVQSLIEENELLKHKIEKKDKIMMKQVMVIKDLASKIRNTISEPTSYYFSIV